jgi:hypothetical protein
MHPFIGDLSGLSLEEIQTKISDITSKINYVSRSGNNYLMYQLNLALETYREAYRVKTVEQFNAGKDSSPLNNIDIS